MIYLFIFAFILIFPGHAAAFEKEAGEAGKLAVITEKQTDNRVKMLKNYLISMHSPLAVEAHHFIREADRLALDWRLVAAIAGTESTFGKFLPPSCFNGWGWGIPTGATSGMCFANWRAGITTVSVGLRKNYIDRGATTLERIGRRYAASPHWAKNTRYFLQKILAYKPTRPTELDITL